MDSKQQQAPLQGRYWLTVLFVLLALVPDLLLSTGVPMLRQSLAHQLHTSMATIDLAETFSNAGWAFGAVLASYLALHYPTYKLNLLYEAVFIVGSLLGLVAPAAPFIVAGRILQGTSTGMLLVSTLPPLIRNFPKERLTSTAAVVDIGFFSAIAAGPIVGGYVAATGTWRWFFGMVGVMALAGFVLAYLVVPRNPGYDRSFPFDYRAIGLAAAAAGLTFYGVGAIEQGTWTLPQVWVPTALGLLCMVALIVDQYRRQNALMPVKPLTSTYPLMGISAGIVGGLAFTTLANVLLVVLMQGYGYGPLGAGLLFWPALFASLVASLIFGALFPTRYVLLLPAMGLTALAAGALVLTTTIPSDGIGKYLWVTGLIGLGAGLTVSPGLFMAGLSVPPPLVGRAFALVELLRLAGAFAFVPAFTYFATIYGTRLPELMRGAHIVYWVTLIVVLVSMVAITAIFALGGARIHAPNLRAYLEEDQAALESPPVVGRVAWPNLAETLRSALRSTAEPLTGNYQRQDGAAGQSAGERDRPREQSESENERRPAETS